MDPQCKSWRLIAYPILIVSALAASAVFVRLVLVAIGSGERSGRGATSEEVKKQLFHKIDLPRGSGDINYRSNLWMSVLDFKVREGDFLAWCRIHKGWKVKSVTPNGPAGFPLIDGQTRDTLVEDGFRFDSETKCRLVGVFDRATGRVGMNYSSR